MWDSIVIIQVRTTWLQLIPGTVQLYGRWPCNQPVKSFRQSINQRAIRSVNQPIKTQLSIQLLPWYKSSYLSLLPGWDAPQNRFLTCCIRWQRIDDEPAPLPPRWPQHSVPVRRHSLTSPLPKDASQFSVMYWDIIWGQQGTLRLAIFRQFENDFKFQGKTKILCDILCVITWGQQNASVGFLARFWILNFEFWILIW